MPKSDNLRLVLLGQTFAVCRFDPNAAIPEWASTKLVNITRTDEELSIVARQSVVPADVRQERDWRCLRVVGPLDFALVGVLASLVAPLSQAGVSVFVISTFDTDYLMVKEDQLTQTVTVLERAGHTFEKD